FAEQCSLRRRPPVSARSSSVSATRHVGQGSAVGLFLAIGARAASWAAVVSLSSWLRRRDLPLCAVPWRRRQRGTPQRGAEQRSQAWRRLHCRIDPLEGNPALPARLPSPPPGLGRRRRSRCPSAARCDAGEIASGKSRGASATVLECAVAPA